MEKFEIKVRVGVAPDAGRMLATEDIESLFFRVEEIFFEVCDIDIKLVIHEVKGWDTKYIEELQRNKDSNNLCENCFPLENLFGRLIFEELGAWLVGLYYMLGLSGVDILIGFAPQTPSRYGIGSCVLRTCICVIEMPQIILPYILTHEILHVFGVKHEDDNAYSIMYQRLGEQLVKSPETIDYLTLDKERQQKAKQGLEKLIKQRKKGG